MALRVARDVLLRFTMGALPAFEQDGFHSVGDMDPASGVRPRPIWPSDGESGGKPAVLELMTPRKSNRLHAGYRALLELGMRIVRAEVRAVGSHVLQKLYLREADERALSDARLSEARAALRDVHGPSRLLDPDRKPTRPRAKRLRDGAPVIGAAKWQR
jgi:hypothetical protein